MSPDDLIGLIALFAVFIPFWAMMFYLAKKT
jgi:hypothetical protein